MNISKTNTTQIGDFEMSKVNRIKRSSFIFLIVLSASAGVLTACDEMNKYSSGPAQVQILDKTFVIPESWNYWRYGKRKNANEESYMQLWFDLNVHTFENIKPNYKEDTSLNLEIRPIRSEFGEKYFWTNESHIHDSKKFNCKSHIYKFKEYELCQHESRNRLASGVDHAYSLKDIKTGEYISVFGCKEPFPEDSNLNDTCGGRSRFLDNLQIEYVYRAEHSDRALDLDHKVREIALSLYQPLARED